MLVDAFDDSGHSLVLEEVGVHAEVGGLVEEVLVLVHCEEDDLHRGRALEEEAGQLQTVHARHVDVDHRDLHCEPTLEHFEGPFGAVGISHNLQ